MAFRATFEALFGYNFSKNDKFDSLNRIVYASPSYGGSGYEKPCSGFALCTVFLRHSFLRP
jgi:hypothetical protein